MNKINPTGYRKGTHRLAVFFAVTVFPLIWLGGLVTTTDAGMAVPDWPNTYGYNLFLYPVYDWFFGPWDLFVEHGHRLLASFSGLVAIVMVVVAMRSDHRSWYVRISVLALALVIFQGILGGVRVVLDDRQIAKLHGCLGPAFFAIVAVLAATSSKWWYGIKDRLPPDVGAGHSIVLAALVMLVLSFGQLVIGAHLRHVAVDADPTYFRFLVASHILVAALVVIVSVLTVVQSTRREFSGCGVRNWTWGILALVMVQIGLGLSTWVVKYGWPVWMDRFQYPAHFVIGEKSFAQTTLVTSHVAIGSLILAFSTVLFVRALRLASLRKEQLATTSTQLGVAT